MPVSQRTSTTLDDNVRGKTIGLLSGLVNPVRLFVFTQETEYAHYRENPARAEEVAALSDRLSLEGVLTEDKLREEIRKAAEQAPTAGLTRR